MLNDGIIVREKQSQEISCLKEECGSPKSVKIEVASACNLKCKICYNKFAPRHSLMSHEDFKIALDNVIDMNIKQVGLLYLGESTLNPLLIPFIKDCKNQGIEYVFLTTNGILIKDDYMKELMSSGLDSIKFSLNQYNKDDYLKETGVDAFDIVVDNIKKAWEYKVKNNLNIRLYISTVTDDIPEDMDSFFKELSKYSDEHIYNSVTNHGGLEDNGKCSHIKDGLIPCPRLFNNTYICSNLDVMCCCNGFTDKFKIGNLHDDRLKNIWNNGIIKELRRKHISGNLEGTICNGC